MSDVAFRMLVWSFHLFPWTKLIRDQIADLAVLNNCRRARGAAYQRGNRRGCLRGTRDVVINDIELWTKDFNKSPVFWLNCRNRKVDDRSDYCRAYVC